MGWKVNVDNGGVDEGGEWDDAAIALKGPKSYRPTHSRCRGSLKPIICYLLTARSKSPANLATTSKMRVTPPQIAVRAQILDFVSK